MKPRSGSRTEAGSAPIGGDAAAGGVHSILRAAGVAADSRLARDARRMVAPLGEARAAPGFYDLLKEWLLWRTPGSTDGDLCVEAGTGRNVPAGPEAAASDRPDSTAAAAREAARLSMAAYAFPSQWRWLSGMLQTRQTEALWRAAAVAVAEDGHGPWSDHVRQMSAAPRPAPVALPDGSRFCGFFVRTPAQLWDRGTGRPVARLPDAGLPERERQRRLLGLVVSGGVGMYVLREALPAGEGRGGRDYRCLVMYRGTLGPLAGTHQYGMDMENTQLYRVPDWDVAASRLLPGGSDRVPCVMYYYAELVANLLPHALRLLGELGAWGPRCAGVLWTGHSMGGALAGVTALELLERHPAAWRASRFAAVAAPMFSNLPAALRLAVAAHRSGDPLKMLEVVNADDVVNVRHALEIEARARTVAQAAVSRAVGRFAMGRLLAEPGAEADESRETALLAASAIRGAVFDDQREPGAAPSLPEGVRRRLPVRLCSLDRAHVARAAGVVEPALTGDAAGGSTLLRCERQSAWAMEFLGRAHTHVLGASATLFGVAARDFENAHYYRLAKHPLPLAECPVNRLVVVPMFMERDAERSAAIAAREMAAPYSYRSPLLPFAARLGY